MTRILVAGDFACFDRTTPFITSGRFEELFGEVRSCTGQADYAIVNFEAPVVLGRATPIAKTGPNIKVPRQAVEAIKYAGFHAVTLAHNHVYDHGEQGVKDTIATLNEEGIEYWGAGKNMAEARTVKYKTIHGKIFAFLNFCEAEWCIATRDQGGANPLNPVTNYYDIQEARAKADYIVVVVHGGHELYPLPSPRMKETYRFFVDAGADVVINGHQHCFSGHEVYNNKPIFYGLGNFLFDFLEDRDTAWNHGYMVNLTFDDAGTSFEQIPYIQCGDRPGIEILKDRTGFDKEIAGLNAVILDDEKLQAAFEEMAASRKSLLSWFEPYNNRYARGLVTRGFLPRFFNARKRMLLLNLARAQAHRDVLLQILNVKS